MSETYSSLLRDELAEKPLDRALLSTFAELVRQTGVRRVIDAGCGPGRITDVLHHLDLDAYGLDLSPNMIGIARRSYPQLRFEVGDIGRLPDATDSLGGVVAWYSTIHTPPEQLSVVVAEFHRVLTAGGWLLLAFQIGIGCVRRSTAYGHRVDLDNYFRDVGEVVHLLTSTGFAVRTRVEREPEPSEKSRHAYLLARAS